jgi:sensor histidine kinase regulating citrate/malate metabolism
MKLRSKITLLTITVAVSVGLLIVISVRGVFIDAFRGELEKKAISIAGNLSDRIANYVLLKDYFQTSRPCRHPDLEPPRRQGTECAAS